MERKCEMLEMLLKGYVSVLVKDNEKGEVTENIKRKRCDKLTHKILMEYYSLDVDSLRKCHSHWLLRLRLAFEEAMEASLTYNTWDSHMASVMKSAAEEMV